MPSFGCSEQKNGTLGEETEIIFFVGKSQRRKVFFIYLYFLRRRKIKDFQQSFKLNFIADKILAS